MEFFIPIAVVLINLVISLLLWSSSRTRLNRTLIFVWITSGLNFISLVATKDWTPFLRMTVLFFLVLASYSTMARLLSIAVDKEVPWKKLYFVVASLFALSNFLYLGGASPILYGYANVLGPSIVLGYPAFEVLVSKNNVSTIARAMALTCIAFSLHALDYPALLEFPHLLEIGHMIGIVLVFSLSALTPALVAEKEATTRERIESDLRYGAALAHASKMAALGEMAGSIAHQINSPLSVIQLNAEAIRRLSIESTTSKVANTEARAQLDRSTGTILATVDRIAMIVKALAPK